MFERQHHRKIISILECLNADFLAQCKTYFGGGTLVSLKHGEHRLSEDIDFLCSCEPDFRRLRRAVKEGGYNTLFARFDNITLPNPIKEDMYAIRFPIVIDGTLIKLEIVSEERLEFGNPDYPSWSPVACLNSTDSFACKLLANADRWVEKRRASRDLIDLAVQRLVSPLPEAAIAAAQKNYDSVIESLRRAVANFQQQPDYRAECFTTLQVKSRAIIIDGLDLLATDLGLEATERSSGEINWDWLEPDTRTTPIAAVEIKPSNETNSPKTPCLPTPPTEDLTTLPLREPWENAMLSEALESLRDKGTTEEDIQTATFANGKFRAILHVPTETLSVVDENQHRGTLYKTRKGEAATINEFTAQEKERFLQQQSQQNRSTPGQSRSTKSQQQQIEPGE